jgi:glycerophosphoryl diester phosphodiesterase
MDDLEYWVQAEPAFGKQAVLLDNRYGATVDELVPTMAEVKAKGINILAPAMWMLLTPDADGNFKASEYTKAAKAEGLGLIAWTLERSGPFPQVIFSPFSSL